MHSLHGIYVGETYNDAGGSRLGVVVAYRDEVCGGTCVSYVGTIWYRDRC